MSVNDAVWHAVIKRAPRVDFSLPAMRNREEASGGLNKKRPAPTPMPDSKVMVGWERKSRDELLALPDWIPPQVRSYPRPYLEQPGITDREQRRNDLLDQGIKKRRYNDPARDSSTPTPYTTTLYATTPYTTTLYTTKPHTTTPHATAPGSRKPLPVPPRIP